MKKLLLSAALLAFAYGEAQVLFTESFNGLTVGNLGTDFAGETAGQGNWLTFANNGTGTGSNAGNSNFQVVADGFEGQALHVTTTDGSSGTRFVWQNGLPALWETRTAGNDVINVEYHFFTGAQSASTTQNGMRLYGTDASATPAALRTLAGFVYVPSTRVLSGIQYLNNNGTPGTFLIGLGPNNQTPLTLQDNTWYRIGFSYNTVTGAVIWSGPGFENVFLTANFNIGPFPIVSCEIVSGAPATNATSATIGYDNITFKAAATSELLSREQDFATANFSVYPNPANDIVNINAGSTLVKSLQVTDMNGRVVKNVNVNNLSQTSLNISDLNTGLYLLSVFTNEGVGTVKLVKN